MLLRLPYRHAPYWQPSRHRRERSLLCSRSIDPQEFKLSLASTARVLPRYHLSGCTCTMPFEPTECAANFGPSCSTIANNLETTPRSPSQTNTTGAWRLHSSSQYSRRRTMESSGLLSSKSFVRLTRRRHLPDTSMTLGVIESAEQLSHCLSCWKLSQPSGMAYRSL